MEPKLCLPGSFAAAAETESCDLCPAGEYQDLPGKTGCKPCARGSYCEVGTAKPTPCPAGTASNVTGLSVASSCALVGEGFWAPLGSAVPEPCPASGFYCPGYELDTVNALPGSKPIIMPVGGSTETQDVEVVEQQMDITIDCNTFNLDLFKQTLADTYEVNVALITVADPCAEDGRRRRLQQSVSITISIGRPAGLLPLSPLDSRIRGRCASRAPRTARVRWRKALRHPLEDRGVGLCGAHAELQVVPQPLFWSRKFVCW